MPYASVSEVPSYVPENKRKQWLEVWNSAHAAALKEGKEAKDAEAKAFREANGVAGPSTKVLKGTNGVQYVQTWQGTEQCQFCKYYTENQCFNEMVLKDDEIPDAPRGGKSVDAVGHCGQWEKQIVPEDKVGAGLVGGPSPSGGTEFAAPGKLNPAKFIKFEKVDASKREVWGIVTAEVPDKDYEVCDYDKSKPYYQAVIGEMSKATDGENFMPLRAMHRTEAVGKCIGYEFRDADKEIFMGFKVVDEKAWKLVEERVYTGFSHGGVKVGDMTPDPVYKDCMRYVAKPAEVSLVDNPCLGVAHFTYIYKTGEVELRKNRCVVDQFVSLEKFNDVVGQLKKTLDTKVTMPKLVVKAAKTKRVAGEDLPSSAFLIVGDAEKTDTWHLPVRFSTPEKTKRHVRNALARLNQVKGISEAERENARKKLHSMASSHGINVDKEKALHVAVFNHLRKQARVKVSRLARAKGDPGWSLTFLDSHLGKLQKGMGQVSHLACVIDDVACLLWNVMCEQEWEGDETSPLPEALSANLDSLLDSLVAMAHEESDELRDLVDERLSSKLA